MPSDAELICEWWVPRDLTLDALHEVEDRLTDEQWCAYEDMLIAPVAHLSDVRKHFRALVHADSATKIAALADVLDPERKLRGEKHAE